MLPQFGYIVAQAGADSRPPPPGLYDHKRTTSSSSPRQAPSNGVHLNTTNKESKLYYNAPPTTAPKSPNDHVPLSMHQKVTGTSSMTPLQYQPTNMYSTTMPTSLASQDGGYYNDRMNTQESPANTSFRPLQQAPPANKTYSWQQQQPTAYMDYSYNTDRAPPSSSFVWHNTPPPFMPPATYPVSNQYDPNDIIVKQKPVEPAEPKILRRLRDYNYLMNWMDNEYWEQNDEMYQEKIQALQKELSSIQEGDHAVFAELVTDLEIIRDQTIASALCFEDYQLTMTQQDYDLNVMMIEDEFKSDTQHLNEMILLVIDEHRKQIKEDRDASSEHLDIDGLFQEAMVRIQQKRKRLPPGPIMPRPETSSRGRRLKNPTVAPHSINAPMTAKEEDDIDFEYMTMKGSLSKRTPRR